MFSIPVIIIYVYHAISLKIFVLIIIILTEHTRVSFSDFALFSYISVFVDFVVVLLLCTSRENKLTMGIKYERKVVTLAASFMRTCSQVFLTHFHVLLIEFVIKYPCFCFVISFLFTCHSIHRTPTLHCSLVYTHVYNESSCCAQWKFLLFSVASFASRLCKIGGLIWLRVRRHLNLFFFWWISALNELELEDWTMNIKNIIHIPLPSLPPPAQNVLDQHPST